MYDVPAAASGDSGLEGFCATVGDRRVGRVVAVNGCPEGLILVIDSGDGYRAAPAGAVVAVETRGETVRLADDAFAELSVVEVRIRRADSPELVRHIPAELMPLVVEGTAGERAAGSRRRVLGAGLAYVGAVALFITAPLALFLGHGSLRWLWIIVPALVFVTGAAILWRELDRRGGRRLTSWEKLADVATFLLGISPSTRTRG